MNRLKKLAALLLVLCLALGLTACAMDDEDAALLGELLTEAMTSTETAAPEDRAAGDELILADEPEPAATPAPEAAEAAPTAGETAADEPVLDPEGSYTSKEDVALYLHTYGTLPPNFITKSEARALGWPGGGLEDYAPGKCIGGDRFGNYEGLLPDGSYHECDIDTLGASSRGAKRIIYSDDGRIYYTDDHYESFTLLYGEE